MVRWTWWDWSLSLGLLLPSVLWHCWLGHLTRKNPSPIWPIICLVGRWTLLNQFWPLAVIVTNKLSRATLSLSEVLSTAAQIYEKSRFKRFAIGERPSESLTVIGNSLYHFLLVACNVPILHCFRNVPTFQRLWHSLRQLNQELSMLLEWATVWPQLYIGRKIGAVVPLIVGELGPHLTQRRLGRGLPPCQVVSWYIKPFGHNTPTLQKGQTGHRSRSIGRTVTCNGRPKT